MAGDRVTGKIALVTGAASGIGRSTTWLLAREGATVIAADIDAHAARHVVDQIVGEGGRAQAVELDVADEMRWRTTVTRILDHHAQLDIVVNNAGISDSRPVAELSWQNWRRVLSTNLDSVFLGTRSAIDAMDRGGSIINVASVSGIRPSAGAAAYCASKAAIRMFSRVVAIECADAQNGIRVNVVTPGGVKTPMWEKEAFFRDLMSTHGGAEEAFAAMAGETPSHRFFSPETVAETIVFLASDESAHLTGIEIVLDRGHSG